MDLPANLVKEFVKSTLDSTDDKKPSRFYGTADVRDDGIYVTLDGSSSVTPVSMVTDAMTGDRVLVEIVDHKARIIQNLDKSNSDIVADRIENDETGVFQELRVGKEYVETLITNDITAYSIVADRAKIGELEADNATINGKLTAQKASIENLEATKLSAKDIEGKYANIDFSNISEATMEKFYAESGLIKNVTIGDATITGELVGVSIKGDRIEGGTIIADKLVVKGEDGLYYKLNTDGETVETEQTDYNSLNGSIIVAKSITASKIDVKDLVAFDATIGGFKIGSDSLYSGVKESVNNTTRGIYLDNTGQIAFGDASNFIKYYKDAHGYYQLEINAKTIKFGLSGTSVEDAVGDSVTSTVEEFYLSDSPTSLSGGSWSTTQPEWTEGKYIWRRTLVTHGDGSTEYTPDETGVCITGNTGPQGEQGRGTQSVTRYYILQSSTAEAPSKPTTNPPPSGWTDAEPTYTSGSTDSLYFCDLTVFSDGTWAYSEVSKSNSYEAAKDAYNKAVDALDAADNVAAGVDELTTIISGNETEPGLAGDFQSLSSQLYGDGETDMGDVGDLIEKSNELDDLTKALSDAQTATDSQLKETAEQLNVYKGYIDINTEEPSITIGAGANSNLKLDPDAINFMVDGSKTTEVTSDGLSANTVEITNIRMRAVDSNGTLTGKLGWIARSNGHLSLKEVV